MRKFQAIGAVVFAAGFLLLVSSGLRFRATADQREGAEKSWSRQQETHAAFQREAAEVSRKLQVGEIDKAGWHREVEVFSTQFKTESEAAGKAWVDQSESAGRLQGQSTNFYAAGLCSVIAGMVTFFGATLKILLLHNHRTLTRTPS